MLSCSPPSPVSPNPALLSLTDVLHHHRVVHCYVDSQGAPCVEDSKFPIRKGEDTPISFHNSKMVQPCRIPREQRFPQEKNQGSEMSVPQVVIKLKLEPVSSSQGPVLPP